MVVIAVKAAINEPKEILPFTNGEINRRIAIILYTAAKIVVAHSEKSRFLPSRLFFFISSIGGGRKSSFGKTG